jgi:hypothetical protein
VTGPLRWIGLSVCLGLCFVWWLAVRNNSPRKSDDNMLTVAEN